MIDRFLYIIFICKRFRQKQSLNEVAVYNVEASQTRTEKHVDNLYIRWKNTSGVWGEMA